MSASVKLRERRAKAIHDMREMTERAEREGRGFSSEEREKREAMFEEIDSLWKDIEAVERLAKLESDLGEVEPRSQRKLVDTTGTVDGDRDSEQYRSNFMGWVANKRSAHELRTMQVDNNDAQGILAPRKMVNGILQAIDDEFVLRTLFTKHTVDSGQTLGVIDLSEDTDEPEWTAELSTGSEGRGVKFGGRELRPYPIARRLTLSNSLLRAKSSLDLEAFVKSRIAYKYAQVFERHYLSGTGANQPLGLLVRSEWGIPASQDSTCASATAIKFDDLMDLITDFRSAYVPRLKFLMHRKIVNHLRKVKDNNGQYVWQPSVKEGEPDTVCGVGIVRSEYMPYDVSAGKDVILAGDFSYYWVVDSLSMTWQKLVELYAEKNKTGYICRMESDGQPVMAEAFRRLKMAAS